MLSYSAPPRSVGVQQRVQRRRLVLDVAEVGLGERVIALEQDEYVGDVEGREVDERDRERERECELRRERARVPAEEDELKEDARDARQLVRAQLPVGEVKWSEPRHGRAIGHGEQGHELDTWMETRAC